MIAFIWVVLIATGLLIGGIIFMLPPPKHSNEASIRFNLPRCQKLDDGTMKCSIKKLPEYQK